MKRRISSRTFNTFFTKTFTNIKRTISISNHNDAGNMFFHLTPAWQIYFKMYSMIYSLFVIVFINIMYNTKRANQIFYKKYLFTYIQPVIFRYSD